ncbi:MAG: LD-carboxypeptidase [Bdellovibrionales bacterium]
MKIAVVAPSCPVKADIPASVTAMAAARGLSIDYHPLATQRHGHFAGPDAARAAAFIEAANSPDYSAVWFARGGYGVCRIVDDVLPQLNDNARNKTYLGYSDAGFMLAALYKNGIGKCVHGPMTMDGDYGSDAAVQRAIGYFLDGSGLEGSCNDGLPHAAFTIQILANLAATPWMPKLDGHVVMLEEVGEHLYAIDRAMFGIMNAPRMKGVAGIRLGRVSAIPDNEHDFGETPEQIVERWCKKTGIPYLGRADIGHDAENKIVPFGKI